MFKRCLFAAQAVMLSLSLTVTCPLAAMPIWCAKISAILGKDINPLEGSATRGTGNFEHVTSSIKNQITRKLKLERISEEKDISWSGPSSPRFARAGSLSYEEWLNADNLKRSHEGQGRDALTEIIAVFTQLGMEQGQRYTTHSQEWQSVRADLADVGSMLKSGDLLPIVGKLDSIQGSLDTLAGGKGTILSDAAKPAASSKNGKIDWPVDGAPMESHQLIRSIVDAINQAYKVTGAEKSNQMLTDILAGELPRIFLQGRQYFHNHNSLFSLFKTRLNLFRSKVDLEIKYPGPSDYLQKTYQEIVSDFDQATKQM